MNTDEYDRIRNLMKDALKDNFPFLMILHIEF